LGKLQEYKPPHFKMRVEERGADDVSLEHILGNFICEYGYKDRPDSEPRPLLKPHRRAFLIQGRGLQGVIHIIDASDDKAVRVTVITLPHDEWGPLPKRFRTHWMSATKKKEK
jgi:hypothetical protein